MTADLPETTAQLQYDVLPGQPFDEALSGAGTNSTPWLHIPRVKYYYRESMLTRGPDSRIFFVCSESTPVLDPDTGVRARRIVGLLEIAKFPGCPEDEYGMKYVSVLPEYQRRHIAAKLLRMLTHFLHAHGACLNRSQASEEGAMKIQSYIDNLFDAHEIRWRQGERNRSNK